MKKLYRIAALLLTVTMLAGLAACTNKSSEGQTGGREFTDSLGRTVTIPAEITRVAVSGALAQIVFYAFAPELLVGWCSSWSEDVAEYIPEEYLRLPVLGQLYGGKGELNLETLLAAAPDLVLDIGEPKDNMEEDLDALTAQTGIPFIHITATTESTADAFRKLGELTGLTGRAEEYAAYCDRVYSRAKDIMAEVGDKRVNALYCLGDAGCNVIAKGAYHAEVIDMFTNNLAELESPSSKGSGNEVDMEQLLSWNPDLILFAPDSVYDSVAGDPLWQELSAISSGHYLKVPYGPYNWMGFPPSIQRYLAMLWLPKVLYPDYCDYDLQAEVTDYYKMFYHCDLSTEQYDKLTKDAFFK